MCDYKPLLFVLPHKLFFLPACQFKLDKKALSGGSSANMMQFCLFCKSVLSDNIRVRIV